ncbi:MAG: site-2 protease family protein [Hymenobacter sp.]
MGGPVEIAQQFGGHWDWPPLLDAGRDGLSMVLAFMNLLPIPALDGGHVLFLLYEIILRRKPSGEIPGRRAARRHGAYSGFDGVCNCD